MKQLVSVIFVMGFACVAQAKLDPFSVYKLKAPENCVDKELGESQIGLPELIQMGICTNPSLSREYMAVKANEAEVGQAKSEY